MEPTLDAQKLISSIKTSKAFGQGEIALTLLVASICTQNEPAFKAILKDGGIDENTKTLIGQQDMSDLYDSSSKTIRNLVSRALQFGIICNSSKVIT
jgi:hypothetical protein